MSHNLCLLIWKGHFIVFVRILYFKKILSNIFHFFSSMINNHTLIYFSFFSYHSDNKFLSRIAGDVFYPNASAWHKYGTRNYLGGIMVEGQNLIACDCEHVWYGHWLRRWLREAAQVNLISKEETEKMLKVNLFSA